LISFEPNSCQLQLICANMKNAETHVSYIIWDIRMCSPLKVSWRFRRTCRLHL
jgi:hypothetical protein